MDPFWKDIIQLGGLGVLSAGLMWLLMRAERANDRLEALNERLRERLFEVQASRVSDAREITASAVRAIEGNTGALTIWTEVERSRKRSEDGDRR